MTAHAVRARGMTTTYGDVVALDGVDLDISEGGIHGLVGPNGAGKTTLLGSLLGLSVPDRGELEVLGVPVSRALGVPAGVTGFVDAPSLYPSLTARQNLTAVAALRGAGPAAVPAAEVDRVLAEVGLTDVADDRLRGFSLGMRQRLGLAAALLGRPRLLVLDEPTNGLDPAGRRGIQRILTRLAEHGATVVVSSHQMGDLAALCDEVSILSAGRVVFTGPVAALTPGTEWLEHRLVTSDAKAARSLALEVRGLWVAADVAGQRPRPGELVVGASEAVMDELVARLVRAGIAIRELTPVTPPLEAAFLALTEGEPRPGEVA
ncbi:ABC transporter ATP-binding protein [Pedococcus sp. NPDC057267]|uniref:ABC transporter ATP-binding protein n=1 Tax=Pedococcus sp. NPDC057267 TaxID=3346077 RepID=UPI00363B222B